MINIRSGLFETNSSSVHSLILCTKNDYQEWLEGEKLLNLFYDSYNSQFDDDEVPQFVTPKEAAQYDKNYPYPKLEEDSWGDMTLFFTDQDGIGHERKFLTFEEYEQIYTYNYETFKDSCITPAGDEIVAFGFFGYDG